MLPILLVSFLSLLSHTHAFYSKDVVELTSSNFKPQVVDSAHNVFLVEFYSPGCGHCVQAKPEFEKTAMALRGIAKVGALDMSKYQEVGMQYKVQAYPAFRIFAGGKATDYNGARTAEAMSEAVFAAMKSLAKSRIAGGSNQENKSEPKKSSGSSSSGSTGGKVVEVSDANFDEMIMKDEDSLWMVAFVAPWCGHCKNLKPEWATAAQKLKDIEGIKIAQVDATASEALARRFGVQGFPTIKVFGPGPKKESSAQDYQGAREAADIVNFAQSTFERMGGQVKIEMLELVDQSVFDKTCAKEKKCVVVILGDLLDVKAKQRTAQIEVIKNVAKKARHIPFVWSAANAQPKLESAYQLDFGFPAVVMLRSGPNGEKVGFVHRGKFTEDALSAFVNAPRGLAQAIQGGWPEISKVQAWDGKSEAPKPKEENDDFDINAFLKEN